MTYIKTINRNGFSFRVMNVNDGIVWPNYSDEKTMDAIKKGDRNFSYAFGQLIDVKRKLCKEMTEDEREKAWEEYYEEKDNNQHETKTDPGWIYLVQEESGYYKIGLTRKSVEERLHQLSRATPLKLELLHTAKTNHVGKDERFLHRLFRHRRYKGEWFDLTKMEIDFLVSDQWITS
jgi:hypothetical protein